MLQAYTEAKHEDIREDDPDLLNMYELKMVHSTDVTIGSVNFTDVYSLYIDGLLVREWFFGHKGRTYVNLNDYRRRLMMEGFIEGLAYAEQMTLIQSELFAAMVIERAERDGEFTVKFRSISDDE